MRKRLKKKYELGPYKRFGFDVTGKLNSTADSDLFYDHLILFLEENQMQCGGGIGPKDFDLYIDAGTRNLNPIRNKEIVINWLKNRDDLLSFEANELHDFDDKPFYD